MKQQPAKKRFAVGTQVRVLTPEGNGTVIQVDDTPTMLAEYWHRVKTERGERREPGSNLELTPAAIRGESSESKMQNHVPEPSAKAKVSAKLEARKSRLRALLQDLEMLRLCGPGDDPDEQTSVIESYRYLLINIKVLSTGLVSSDTAKGLDGFEPKKIESIYDVYSSKAYLDALAPDIACDLDNISEVSHNAPPRHLISADLIKALREAKPKSFDALRLAEYCREINSGFAHGNLISCILLMRAVLNHVPPVFGHSDFSQVVAHASRSLKANFEHLDESLRKIGDLYTHQHMRRKEHLPTPGQVDKFGPQFELLLQEILTRL